MTEAQVWAIIGVFATLFFSVLVLMSNMFVRVLRSEIGRLESKFDARFDAVDTKIEALDSRMSTRFDAVDARFMATDTKIDALDRDVQLLFHREFGTGTE